MIQIGPGWISINENPHVLPRFPRLYVSWGRQGLSGVYASLWARRWFSFNWERAK